VALTGTLGGYSLPPDLLTKRMIITGDAERKRNWMGKSWTLHSSCKIDFVKTCAYHPLERTLQMILSAVQDSAPLKRRQKILKVSPIFYAGTI
jgi:hypothetical protein